MPDTSAIQIDVATQYLSDQSLPAENRFVFAYTITITHHRHEAVRLLSRYWRITDADNHVQEVRGDGVIGEQPLIASGGSYRYSSGAMLATPIGTMEGSYQMVTDTGESFEAPIRAFSLARPGMLH